MQKIGIVDLNCNGILVEMLEQVDAGSWVVNLGKVIILTPLLNLLTTSPPAASMICLTSSSFSPRKRGYTNTE